eukprot:gb/GECH01003092.1/.p1 GENE.gb/GECH01003092.1/~~gb/GECH01003092.1/.p1  ORF type:complete len:378 (+),score=82.75 gb/GECH01003092.1/:1-1134(+)
MDRPPIVIDNGSGMVKSGLAGETAPRVVFPSIVAYPKHSAALGANTKSYYIGDEVQQKRSVCVLRYPVQHGIVQNWEDMARIWQHTFDNELKESPRDRNIMLTEPPLNPRRNRETMAGIMLEEFDAAGIWIGVQAVLSLYATGRTSGIVLDIGDGVSHTVPVYEGRPISHATERIDLAGRDLTHYLVELLYQRGYPMESSAELEIVRDVKESLAYVAYDYESELDQVEEQGKDVGNSYALPDGSILTIDSERFRCVEPLFQPNILGRDIDGIDRLLYNSISNSPVDLRSTFYNSIVLSGGSTMISGMQARIKKEITELSPEYAKVKVVAPPARQFSVYIGASVLASLSSFEDMWVTKDEWLEEGYGAIIRKCGIETS